jgi:lipopolysaccharide/colanic/teichoic acid biosynthesis glycosyltransferase
MLKRVFDIAVAVVGLVLLSPVFALIGVGVLLTLGRPVFYRQLRPGKDGRLFPILKFRTMSEACDDVGVPLPDGERLSRFGRVLRGSSLDELPELANVLRGQMSLVGPRPLLSEYQELYTPEQRRRHEMTPGVTGWAQVSGRNLASWPERLAADVWYVDNWSLGLDFRILLKTIRVVLTREGISAQDHATAPRFTGSD